MTFVVIVLVSSYWCSRLMNETTSPMSLLTHDLDVRSCGSPGRKLIGMIKSAGLEVVEAERPIDFARRLQSPETEARVQLENLLEWTPAVSEFQLVALVALAPRLERCAARLGRGRPSADTVSEVLSYATTALHDTDAVAEGERSHFVLNFAFSRSRCSQRKVLRHNISALTLGPDEDFAEPAIDSTTTLTEYFDEAIEAGIITSEECELIEMTRLGGCSLRQWSDITDQPLGRLTMRRIRAEARLREHFNLEQVQQ